VSEEPPLLAVENLHVTYGSGHRRVEAVRGVSFEVRRGQTVGLVGESGCGKSSIARALVRLVPASAGHIRLRGEDVAALPSVRLKPFRRAVQMVFQDPHLSLNPHRTVAELIGEAFQIHFPELSRAERRARAGALLQRVGLETDMLDRLPAHFSGGQRQRIGIARALAVEPELMICDEPVSALDVSVQAQIINLLQDLQQSSRIALLFIAHDLAVVEHISHRILVMRAGQIVEDTDPHRLVHAPQHPYTRALIDAVPRL